MFSSDLMTNEYAVAEDGQVEIWYCSGCKAVHLCVGEARRSFDRDRFAEFAGMVADLQYESFAGHGGFDILNAAKEIKVEYSKKRTRN